VHRYDARLRTLFRALAAIYELPWAKVLQLERLWLETSLTACEAFQTARGQVRH
jgi:hypothetical protein